MPFAKHETFYIRDGWLYKGLKAVSLNETIFLNEDASQQLGLGKNMVRALRFWMQATGLAYEKSSRRGKTQHLTTLGQIILQYDPYQELDGTLWLLHHHLVCSRNHATAWYWFFNHYAPLNFSKQDFVERLSQWVNAQESSKEEITATGSLVKDFDCLIHTYVPNQRDRSPEDLMESPLASLGLLTAYAEADEDAKKMKLYRLQSPRASNIPPLVFLYVLLQRQEHERTNARQVPLSSALRDAMNVGRTFNIGIQGVEELIGRLQDDHPELAITLTRTGGLDQIDLPDMRASEVLTAFYERHNVAEDVQTWSFPIN